MHGVELGVPATPASPASRRACSPAPSPAAPGLALDLAYTLLCTRRPNTSIASARAEQDADGTRNNDWPISSADDQDHERAPTTGADHQRDRGACRSCAASEGLPDLPTCARRRGCLGGLPWRPSCGLALVALPAGPCPSAMAAPHSAGTRSSAVGLSAAAELPAAGQDRSRDLLAGLARSVGQLGRVRLGRAPRRARGDRLLVEPARRGRRSAPAARPARRRSRSARPRAEADELLGLDPAHDRVVARRGAQVLGDRQQVAAGVVQVAASPR